MAGADETLAAAAAILQGLAREPRTATTSTTTAPSSSSSSSYFSSAATTISSASSNTQPLTFDFRSSSTAPYCSSSAVPTTSHSANGVDIKLPKLPGESSPAKAAFENELGALVRRVRLLESQTVSLPNLLSPNLHHSAHPTEKYWDFLASMGLSRPPSADDSGSDSSGTLQQQQQQQLSNNAHNPHHPHRTRSHPAGSDGRHAPKDLMEDDDDNDDDV
jgi:osomolarity two-component system sensor histidine kinase NIK1